MFHVIAVSSPDAVFTLLTHTGSTVPVGSIRYLRVLALRAGAFASIDHSWTSTSIVTTSTGVSTGPVLVPTGTATRFLYMASSWSSAECPGPTLRRLHFVVGSGERVVEHASDNCALMLTYGTVGLLASRPASLSNGASSASGPYVEMRDSHIVLLGLP